MRVLLVSQYFWPETFRINEVVRSLRDAGADVTVLTGKPNYPDGVIFDGYSAWGTRREEYQGIPVLRVPMTPRRRGSAIGLAMNYLSFVFGASVFGPWLLRGRQVDVIIVYGISPILQGIPAIVMKLFKRCPAVLWVQDLWPQSLEATGFVRNRSALKAVEWVVRAIYRFSDLLLVQSMAFIDPVAALSDRRKIAYHPNPGELAFEEQDPAAAGEPPFQCRSSFNVLFAGNLGTVQAVDTIIDAAERLKTREDIRFVLVGSGSRADWIRGEIRRRELSNVDLPGRFPPESMPAILRAASVLLVTLARSDIFRMTVPSKVQAYLAAGKPILAALDGEGARVVSEAGAGVAVEPEDAQALADAVQRMSQLSEQELVEMGRRGRAYYHSHFAPDLLAGRLIEHLERAILDYHRR
jgi:glycosyltransferase involved in cell wall biosynthesis